MAKYIFVIILLFPSFVFGDNTLTKVDDFYLMKKWNDVFIKNHGFKYQYSKKPSEAHIQCGKIAVTKYNNNNEVILNLNSFLLSFVRYKKKIPKGADIRVIADKFSKKYKGIEVSHTSNNYISFGGINSLGQEVFVNVVGNHFNDPNDNWVYVITLKLSSNDIAPLVKRSDKCIENYQKNQARSVDIP